MVNAQKNMFEKFKVFLGLEDSESVNGPAEQTGRKSNQKNASTISLSYFKKGFSEVKIISPKKYSDALNIANLLKEETPMIVNFQYLDSMNMKRFMDFISGTIYSLNGHLARLTDNIIMLTPAKIIITEDQPEKTVETLKNNANEEIVVSLINNN
ncbi:MAG: cell division protein SepF [Candidatus Margulisbacteria bacterium]|nr:cell division protein SepF [Candidatus Margulisiibacteriota bacterium]